MAHIDSNKQQQRWLDVVEATQNANAQDCGVSET
jgi:hypothetical protein